MTETSATPAKRKKATKSNKSTSHPKYSEMIKSAINSDHSRSGASRQCIQKYIKTNYKVNENSDLQVKLCLKRMLGRGVVRHTKGIGASGSFKLVTESSKAVPQKPPAKAKKPVAKATKPKKVVKKAAKKTPVKKPAAKKPKKTKATKKASPVKAKKAPAKKAVKAKAATKTTKTAKPRAKPAKKAAKPRVKAAKKTTKAKKK